MTKEDKELLLKDLSARLQYGVYIRYGINGKSILTGIEHKKHPERWIIIAEGPGHYLDDIKPYLRPMSSMTEEEREKFRFGFGSDLYGNIKRIDWLNKKMFDYRKDDEGKTMIEKGLALEAPEGMYKMKELKARKEK